jgi:hypothetical protein
MPEDRSSLSHPSANVLTVAKTRASEPSGPIDEPDRRAGRTDELARPTEAWRCADPSQPDPQPDPPPSMEAVPMDRTLTIHTPTTQPAGNDR